MERRDVVIPESGPLPRDSGVSGFSFDGSCLESRNKDREHSEHLRRVTHDMGAEHRKHRPVSSNLVGFVRELAPATGAYPQVKLAGDLVDQLKCNFSDNNIFIPLLQTVNVLLDGGALDLLNGNAEGEKQ
jgi:hypothetical protein